MADTTYKEGYRRMLAIDDMLRNSSRQLTTAYMAKKLGTSQRTIQRTLKYMAEILYAPIDYDTEKKTWYYTMPNFRLTDFKFTDPEVKLFLLIDSILASLFGERIYESTLKDTFESIVEHATSMTKLLDHRVHQNIEVVLPNACDFEIAEKVTEAMDSNLCVWADCNGTETLIRPIRLIYAWDRWYLLYITEAYKTNEDFHLVRICSFKGFRQATKGESQKVKDIFAELMCDRGFTSFQRYPYLRSDIKHVDGYGDVLRIRILGGCGAVDPGYSLWYRRSEDGTMVFIKSWETMHFGHFWDKDDAFWKCLDSNPFECKSELVDKRVRESLQSFYADNDTYDTDYDASNSTKDSSDENAADENGGNGLLLM